jgi:SAM-dependent methyltransferase
MAEPIRDHALERMSEAEAMELEDTLWWAQGRKHIIREYLKAAKAAAPLGTVMDIGCGSGGNFDVLAEFGRVVGVDRSPVLVERARGRGIATAVYQQDVFGVPEVGATDIFTLFDVLEHIEEDGQFVSRLSRSGPRRHMLLISVPACQWLYSGHDQLLNHHRRYSKSGLEALLRNGGYEILKSGYFMCVLFPVAVLSRLTEKLGALLGRKQTGVRIGAVPGWMNGILANVLRAEAVMSGRVTLPIGLWLFALARCRSRDERE